MKPTYNRFAGQSLERLAALSDGIFAVAMTLLVLDLRVPASQVIHNIQPLWVDGALSSEQVLWTTLVHLGPRLLTYFMSFLTLGIFWVAQQTQFTNFAHSDRNFAWIHLAYLLGVSLMPFSTSFLAEFITYRLALVVYWFNLFLLGLTLLISVRYAWRAGLVKEDVSPELRFVHERRIFIYQALYAGSLIFCILNPYLSIGLIILLQLNSVFAPRIHPFDWINGESQ